MGGCYSRDSEYAVASPQHKLPTDQPASPSLKGLPYTPLLNGADSQYQEDEVLKPDALKYTADVAPTSVQSHHSSENTKKAKGVAPSDSGIGSICPSTDEAHCGAVEKKDISLCQSCHSVLKRISLGPCEQCGQFRLGVTELNSLEGGVMYCTCSPGQGRPQADCQHHTASPARSPNRHSDIPARQLKSNLKKEGQEKGDSKHVRMSWRSADSVDLASSMTCCLDRAKSEASDVFCDDISYSAPLAAFDSVDRRLDGIENADTRKGDATFLTSTMSIYSEILKLTGSICHCDYSGSADGEKKERDCRACQRSVSEDHSVAGSERQSQARLSLLSSSAPPLTIALTSDLTEELEGRKASLSNFGGQVGKSSGCERLGMDKGEDILSGAVSSSLFGCAALDQYPVSVILRGRHMVLMDASDYIQLLDDLSYMKTQLQRLATVIQGQEEVYIEDD